METHRYTRNQLLKGTLDAYDYLPKHYPQSNGREYWTNGRTTHRMTTPHTPAAAEKILPAVKRKRTASTTSYNVVRNSIVAGSISGVVSTAVVYPFDVLRTKMQSSAQLATAQQQGPMQVLSHTWQHGGMRALYTGVSLPLAAQAVYKATVFSTNQICQRALLDYKTLADQKTGRLNQKHTLTMMDHFVCGFVGGAVNAAAFVTPVEFVRNQLIVQHTKLAAGKLQSMTGPMDVIRSTITSHGVAGLWRGVGMTVARDSLGCGCFFVSMAYCRQLFVKKGERASLGVAVLSGACAGWGFWVVALPLDTVKTWVQDGSASSARYAVSESITKHGWLRTAQRVCRGWQMAFGRGAPSAALTIGTYEFFYRKMEQL
jgi:hypothetical protein